MTLPKFKPSTTFVEDLKLPCLAAKVENSKLPAIGARHIAEFEDDPECVIYLRGAEPQKISPWQQEMLGRLFTGEGLAAAVTEAMKEYETSDEWGGKDWSELSEEDQDKIRQHGIAAYIVLYWVVVDEVKHEVVMNAHTIIDGNLDEHGISIYLKKGRWHFDTAEYYIRYISSLE